MDIACGPITSLQSPKVPHISDTEKVAQKPQGRKRFTGSRALLSDVKENIESSSAEANSKVCAYFVRANMSLMCVRTFLANLYQKERSLFVKRAFVTLAYKLTMCQDVVKRERNALFAQNFIPLVYMEM